MNEPLDGLSFEALSYYEGPTISGLSVNHSAEYMKSVIGAGVTFGRRAQALAKPIREAVACFADLCSPDAAYSACATALVLPTDRVVADDYVSAIRLGWWLANVYLFERRRSPEDTRLLNDALHRFFGERKRSDRLLRHIPTPAIDALEELLSSVEVDEEFVELLPYILEPHGPGSRHSVMRDRETAANREAKKAAGVFYTPQDVAAYMLREANSEYGVDWTKTVTYDPACGTGTFLVEQAKEFKRYNGASLKDYVVHHLFGTDICVMAVDSAAFGLLHTCLDEDSPWSDSLYTIWQVLRTNIVTADALTIVANQTAKSALPCSAEHAVSMCELFKNLTELPGIICGNPPYAALGERDDFFALQRRFSIYRQQTPKPSDSLHPLFVEQMWHLSNPTRAATSLVLPLSIAYASDKLHMSCRVGMMQSGMEWRCANFDREPHALFGEDVKTRNTILFGRKTSANKLFDGLIGTTALMRWTSRNRDKLFQNIRFTYLKGCDFAPGLPKLSGEAQAKAFIAISSHAPQLGKFVQASRAISLANINSLAKDEATIFVAPTAYNFLNVFRASDLWARETTPLSESPVLALTFASHECASAAFATLSSRLAYWLWTVNGDGFHVTKRFVESLPAWSDEDNSRQQLSLLGDQMWGALQQDVIRSVNKGRITIAFRPTHCAGTQTKIDSILGEACKLPHNFSSELQQFSDRQRIVDPQDKKRTQKTKAT